MRIILIFIFSIFICSCKSSEVSSKKTSEHLGLEYKNTWSPKDDSLTFMAFNVENLFDTKHDKGKDDSTYLPLSTKQNESHKIGCEKLSNKRWKDQCLNWDWSESVVDHKLQVLSEVIRKVKNGKGPDILVLEEVENINILKQLNKRGLNYPTVILIEGADKRGIDIGLLTRLKVYKTPKLHPIPFEGVPIERVQDTRGILQVDLKLPKGEILTVFGVHFPAPFHPKEMRVQAFEHLNRLVADLPRGRLAIAGGDFNVPKREDTDNYVGDLTSQHWIVGHKVACKECPGSTYYPPNDSWSFLDMILWSKNFEKENGNWKVIPESFRVENTHPEQRASTGAPKRFEIEGPSGVSDHWPLAVDIVKSK